MGSRKIGVNVNKLGTPRVMSTGEPTVRQTHEKNPTRPAGMSVYSWVMATKPIEHRIEYQAEIEAALDDAIQTRMNARMERLYEKQRAVREARARKA